MTTFTTAERTYEVVFDGAIRRRALIIARVVDAVTTSAGLPVLPRTPLIARVDRRGATVRIGRGGTVAVSGRTAQFLPDPASTASMTFTISIGARGYRLHVQQVIIAAGATLPIDLGTIALQPLPVRLEGRVTREAERTPIAGASIVARKADKIVLLRTPVRRDYLPSTQVTALTLTTSGSAQALTSAVVKGGAGAVMLDDASIFAAGDVVRFAGREYGVIATVTGNEVTLIDPLRHSHAAGTVVAPVTVGAAQATVNLLRPIHAGDALLRVDAETDATAVEIGGEYHDTGLFSDADGYVAVDGIGGERTLILTTTPPLPPGSTLAALQPLTTAVTIDYSKPVNAVSLRLKRA